MKYSVCSVVYCSFWQVIAHLLFYTKIYAILQQYSMIFWTYSHLIMFKQLYMHCVFQPKDAYEFPFPSADLHKGSIHVKNTCILLLACHQTLPGVSIFMKHVCNDIKCRPLLLWPPCYSKAIVQPNAILNSSSFLKKRHANCHASVTRHFVSHTDR